MISKDPSGDRKLGGGVLSPGIGGSPFDSLLPVVSGSKFVKKGESFVDAYQPGAFGSRLSPAPRGSIDQTSLPFAPLSREKTMVSPSGAKIGSLSCPELSFVS